MREASKISYTIELSVFHFLDDEKITPLKKDLMIAENCAFQANALFLIMANICSMAAHGEQFNTNQEELFFGLQRLNELGFGLTENIYRTLDGLENV